MLGFPSFISITIHRPTDCADRQDGAGSGHSHTEHYISLLVMGPGSGHSHTKTLYSLAVPLRRCPTPVPLVASITASSHRFLGNIASSMASLHRFSATLSHTLPPFNGLLTLASEMCQRASQAARGPRDPNKRSHAGSDPGCSIVPIDSARVSLSNRRRKRPGFGQYWHDASHTRCPQKKQKCARAAKSRTVTPPRSMAPQGGSY